MLERLSGINAGGLQHVTLSTNFSLPYHRTFCWIRKNSIRICNLLSNIYFSMFFFIKSILQNLKRVVETMNATFIMSFLILNFKLKSLSQNPIEKINEQRKRKETGRFLCITYNRKTHKHTYSAHLILSQMPRYRWFLEKEQQFAF